MYGSFQSSNENILIVKMVIIQVIKNSSHPWIDGPAKISNTE